MICLRIKSYQIIIQIRSVWQIVIRYILIFKGGVLTYKEIKLREKQGEEELIGLGEIYKSLGFEDEEEYNRLIGKVEMQTPEQIAAYKKWKEEDGTKEGLEKLIDL
jgi:hypothetical protein